MPGAKAICDEIECDVCDGTGDASEGDIEICCDECDGDGKRYACGACNWDGLECELVDDDYCPRCAQDGTPDE